MATPNPAVPDAVDFGFRRVSAEEKDQLVQGVFDQVSSRYDVMNDLMSGGLHRRWKREFIAGLFPSPPTRLVDVAGGTGDIAMRFLERYHETSGGLASPAITVVDANPSMLATGRDRAIDRGMLSGIRWAAGRAEALPLRDRSVEAYTVSFGLRNATDLPKALAEARRVLTPGGRFLCLEFSRPVSTIAGPYDRYSFSVIPVLGRIVVGDAAPYRYLVESIRRFPDQQTFATMIAEAGFSHVRFRNLSGGIVAIHSAWRL
ncbi:MAG: class I SAM-dependent methyltransferase [Alphaproteobacteria bacterium]|nr:class I SAM-dependent methyltransferase [Alphaproteobacteria bacterium]